MLTLKNICKTYRTKGGVPVKALDDVSLTFPETGMVFILGKSGSGKSTLLNVCGGLDAPDSGEIIICGRSSATFSGSDFDSYRNTFVGFIFQEYNILNEFTVEDNLSLALELQGKSGDKQKVYDLLNEVDMAGYAKRKPNTLSGGQKQRVAIARALIKDPRIIMADEPTGALDSKTGRQVLQTLKELSRSRLVIVVSHDREFAEIYGDRVIELKDGKIISDVSKTQLAAEKIGENVTVIDGETLAIKSGKNLTENDLKKIDEYISGADGDIIISRSPRHITGFKKANRIADDGSSEQFVLTNEAEIPQRQYSSSESALVRSKLPIGRAIKMGASSLKVKKFRLFLTILLSVIAFIMFGVFSTLMTYDGSNVVVNSYAQSSYDTVPLTKKFNVCRQSYTNGQLNYSYTSKVSTYFSDGDIAQLNQRLGGTVTGIMELAGGSTTPYNVSTDYSKSHALNDSSVTGVGCAPQGSDYRNMLEGTYPEGNDEIAISYWYYMLLKTQTLYQVSPADSTSSPVLGTAVEINGLGDVIGQYLCMRVTNTYPAVYAYYKITGVYNAGEIPDEFFGWDGSESDANWDDNELISNYTLYIEESMHRVFLVSDTFCENFVNTYGSTASISNYNYDKYFDIVNDIYDDETGIYVDGARVYDPNDDNALAVHWLGEEKTSLSGNEIIVDADSLTNYIGDSINYLSSDTIDAWTESYTQKYGDALEEASLNYDYYLTLYWQETNSQTPDVQKAAEYYELYTYYDDLMWYYNVIINIVNVDFYVNYVANSAKYTLPLSIELFEDALMDYVQNYMPTPLTVTLYDFNGNSAQYEIVGFHDDPSDGNYYYSGAYVSQTLYDSLKSTTYSTTTTNYVLPDDAIYAYAYVCYDGSTSLISEVVKISEEVNSDDSFVYISSTLYSEINTINSLVSILSNVFLYVGIAMAVFAALLLFNFISVSITSKTHEIGVLRAVGARGWDVFKIFFAEAAIITIICLVISIVGTVIIVAYLNSVMSAGLGFPYVLFSFGIISLLMMLGVAAAVAFLGTFIPVFKTSRKKPVDSMRTI